MQMSNNPAEKLINKYFNERIVHIELKDDILLISFGFNALIIKDAEQKCC